MSTLLTLVDFSYRDLPTLNALLNSLAATLLLIGYSHARRQRFVPHFRTMWAAFGVSALFLVSYVAYHTLRQMDEGVGHTVFMLEGPVRSVYYLILFSHIILAFAVVPLAMVSLYRGWLGWRRQDLHLMHRHSRISRWTFPIWLYVSVTGVIVYLMLYHLPGATG